MPAVFHNAGTGVEELGDLILNTRDIADVDALVSYQLIERWANVQDYRLDGVTKITG